MMNNFNNRQELFSILNKMWDLFSSVVPVTKEIEIEQYVLLKDRASELLADEAQTDVIQT